MTPCTQLKSQNDCARLLACRQDTLGNAMPGTRGDREKALPDGGAPGARGRKGSRNGNYKHRRHTAEAIYSRSGWSS